MGRPYLSPLVLLPMLAVGEVIHPKTQIRLSHGLLPPHPRKQPVGPPSGTLSTLLGPAWAIKQLSSVPHPQEMLSPSAPK